MCALSLGNPIHARGRSLHTASPRYSQPLGVRRSGRLALHCTAPCFASRPHLILFSLSYTSFLSFFSQRPCAGAAQSCTSAPTSKYRRRAAFVAGGRVILALLWFGAMGSRPLVPTRALLSFAPWAGQRALRRWGYGVRGVVWGRQAGALLRLLRSQLVGPLRPRAPCLPHTFVGCALRSTRGLAASIHVRWLAADARPLFFLVAIFFLPSKRTLARFFVLYLFTECVVACVRHTYGVVDVPSAGWGLGGGDDGGRYSRSMSRDHAFAFASLSAPRAIWGSLAFFWALPHFSSRLLVYILLHPRT
ncbi:hypothetical protein C8F04DRAFT_1082615 [Mycena alexandri]|uniref:Uncharacterized protein n=1 Tax=Mycena alexandri TaxID=1745969 RepID=A0AAD6X686_9AGAR|nr:hypothetical protein C8F04DRAFT_1082615 [Mycena alexandri]